MRVAADRLTRFAGFLTKRDLTNIATKFRGKYGVSVVESDAGLWTLVIRFEGIDEVYGVESSHGRVKVWRSLSNIILFVQENCKYPRDVVVDVNGWKLVKAKSFSAW